MGSSVDQSSDVSRSFREKLKAYFLPLLPPNDFKWEAFNNFLRRNKEQLLVRENLDIFTLFFMQCLTHFECESVSSVEKMIDLFENLCRYNSQILHFAVMLANDPRKVQKKIDEVKDDIFSNIDQIADPHCNVTEKINVFEVVMTCGVNVMKVLVKSGLCCQPTETWCQEFLKKSFIVEDFFEYQKLSEKSLRPIFEAEEGTIDDRLAHLTFRVPFGEWNLGPRRTLLILVVAQALKWKLFPEALPKYVECVRLLFGTLPEPFVSLHELELFFGFVFYNTNARPVVQNMIHKIKVVFPEILDRPQPRSLLELCRVSVRTQAVRSGHTVIYAVEQLKIPKFLKIFITSSTEFKAQCNI